MHTVFNILTLHGIAYCILYLNSTFTILLIVMLSARWTLWGLDLITPCGIIKKNEKYNWTSKNHSYKRLSDLIGPHWLMPHICCPLQCCYSGVWSSGISKLLNFTLCLIKYTVFTSLRLPMRLIVVRLHIIIIIIRMGFSDPHRTFTSLASVMS